MCTDGLSGLVSDAEFQEAVNGKPLEQACKDLIELAKSRGGHDNITVQLLRVASDNLRKTRIEGAESDPAAAKIGSEAAKDPEQ